MTKPAAKRASSETEALRKGMALFNARHYAEARAHFEAALALNPASSRAAVSLAHALQFSAEPERALTVISALAGRLPKDGRAQVGLADILSIQGRLLDSVEAFEKALVLLPNDAEVRINLARVYLRLRNLDRAETALRSAIALRAGTEASLLLGELLKDKGAVDEAEPLLRRAAANKPASADGTSRMAAGLTRFRANVKLGLFKEAFGEAEALLNADASQDCIDSFFVSPDQKEMQPTLEALKAYSKENPQNPWPYFFRSTLLSNNGRGEEAILEAGRLKSTTKNHAWMRYKLGELLLTNRRDYAGAQREYAAALKCVPGFWKARAALAEIALCRGEAARAAKITEELIAAMPDRVKPWGYTCRGKIMLWSGAYKDALASLDVGVASGAPYSLRYRGAARLLTGRLEDAARDLEDSLRSGPDLEALTWRGELKRRLGDYNGAISDLNAAIRLDGANSFWALANRALAAGAKGDGRALWSDYQTIRRDVLDRFEKAAKAAPKSPDQTDAARAVLEAGLTLARGLRVSNEYLFPVWMDERRAA